ncbi:hypothetical protein MKZ38_009701 [Zalerion maritima]|uniref:Ribosome biogenesis protein ERB1 n=1 Tax=Zalerion maritima TaxID=339359 RepID=A0AAD5RGE9_9PEZI|nr:hypothetical protein MKZ38_009701 [Zalerion maritima]
MPSYVVNKKRKASEEDAVAFDDEFQNGALEAVLSDGSDDEEDSDFEDFGSPSISSLDEAPDKGNDEEEGKYLAAETDDEDQPNFRVETDANGGVRYVYDEIDPVYDSDDPDAKEATNTIGDIPLSFYDSYPHIGYDINGKKIMRPAAGEALDALLDSIEVPKGWTGLTDPETGKPLNLSQEELQLLRKLQTNEFLGNGVDEYPVSLPAKSLVATGANTDIVITQDTVEWFTSVEEKMPLSAAPEPKRRFIPSKHEQKRVMKLVKAIREGRILPYKPPQEKEKEEAEKEEKYFDIWADEQPRDPHVMHIPAPKLPPPGYDQSYNPPPEYLPTKKEKEAWEKAEPEDREKEYLPQTFNALRKVPAYGTLVKERFERCLDLYLAPRIRRNRLNIDPESLLPKLPKPEDLRPFPTLCQKIMRGHEGRVRSVAFDPTGNYIASGGEDGTIRLWDKDSGHELWRAKVSSEDRVQVVRWRPTADTFILAAVVGEDVVLAVPQIDSLSGEVENTSREVLDNGFGYAKNATQLTTASGARKDPPGKWERPGSKLESQGVLLKVTVRSEIKVLNWHRRGDYFCTVSPAGQRSAIAIHNLSKHITNNPIKKLRGGIPQHASFHPTRPLFFIAMQRSIRSYDLSELKLDKTLRPGTRWISSFDLHPGGENLAVASHDRRLVWHDLEKSADPYKTMRFHSQSVRTVKFHKSKPLFADASDDGTMVVFHAKVVSDLSEDAMIVPVKTLKGHQVIDRLGVLDIDWHPTEAHFISAGADGTIRYWG